MVEALKRTAYSQSQLADVLRVAVFQRPLTRPLPAPGGQHQAEGAGVAVGIHANSAPSRMAFLSVVSAPACLTSRKTAL